MNGLSSGQLQIDPNPALRVRIGMLGEWGRGRIMFGLASRFLTPTTASAVSVNSLDPRPALRTLEWDGGRGCDRPESAMRPVSRFE